MRIYRSTLALALWAAPAFAQAPVVPIPAIQPQAGAQATPLQGGILPLCGGAYQIGPPANLPPPNFGEVIYNVVVCFPKQGNVSLIEPQTYLYYMRSTDLVSLPSRNEWKPYNEAAERVIVEDHKRLWATNFLDDLSIEAIDYPFSNGVIGRVIVYNMEERQRIKTITYNEGTKEIDQTKVEERLRELSISMRLDTFVDPGTEKRVANVVRELLMEKGFQDAKVEPVHEPLPGAPKSVALKFRVTEGPKVRISNIDFVGNKVFSDGKLKGKLRNNKGGGFWIFPGSSIYQADKFEEDADALVAFFRENGYLQSNVGQPNLKQLRDSSDGKTRYMTLEIPVTEGTRYRVDKLEFVGNDKVPAEIMRPLFKMRVGDYYNEKRLREGFEKVREIYGAGGHWEMTPLPDFAFDGDKVSVTMRINEGKQYFVNRITFQGNTTTRDNVIRREMRLFENGVFNTEALKYSVRRLNQLGYFKPLEEQKHVQIDKTRGQRQQGRSHDEARGAEPESAVVWRRRVAVRRRVRAAFVLDGEFHGQGRDLYGLAAVGCSCERLPGGVHRAVPLRSSHHGIGRHAQAKRSVHRSVHAGVERAATSRWGSRSERSPVSSCSTATTECT